MHCDCCAGGWRCSTSGKLKRLADALWVVHRRGICFGCLELHALRVDFVDFGEDIRDHSELVQRQYLHLHFIELRSSQTPVPTVTPYLAWLQVLRSHQGVTRAEAAMYCLEGP